MIDRNDTQRSVDYLEQQYLDSGQHMSAELIDVIGAARLWLEKPEAICYCGAPIVHGPWVHENTGDERCDPDAIGPQNNYKARPDPCAN